MPALSSEARAIALLALAAFVSASAFRICDPMLPQLAAEFGTTTGQAARAVTAFAVAYGVLQMFFGPVGDRYGKYRVVSVATFACALGSAGAVMAQSLDMLVLCRALSGAAGAGIVPLSMAWIGDTVPYERRQATLARFLTGTILGMSAGQLAGGLFADTVGWRWAFAALVCGYLIVGLLLRQEVRRQQAAGLGAGLAAGARQGFVAQARLVLGAPWPRVVLATVFIEGLLVFGALAFAPSYLHERFDISLTAAGAGGGLCGGRIAIHRGGRSHPQAARRARTGGGGRAGAGRGLPVLSAGAGLGVEPAGERAGGLRLLPAARYLADQCHPDGAVRARHGSGLVRVLPVHGAGRRRGAGRRGGGRDRGGRAVRRFGRDAARAGRGLRLGSQAPRGAATA